MSEEMTDEDVRAAEDRERKAHVEMQRITGVGEWWGRRESPRISIPADEERDSDLVIGRSLSDVRKLAAECLRRGAEIARLRAEVEELKREEYLNHNAIRVGTEGLRDMTIRAESAEARVAELEAAARRLISAWDSDTQRGITTAEDNLRAILAPKEDR